MSDSDKRTLKELAQAAWDVQDGSNLSGVLLSAGRNLCRLKELLGGNVADSHPITQLWADKISQLAGIQGSSLLEIQAAYSAVKKILGAP